MGWRVEGWGNYKSLKIGINLGLIKIIQVYLKIYDIWRLLHLWVNVWVCGWMGGVMSNH